MGWKDAPLIGEQESKTPAWMSAPVVEEQYTPTGFTESPIKPKENFLGRASRAINETVLAPVAPWLSIFGNKKYKDIGNRAIDPRLGRVGISQVAQEIGDKGRAGGLVASKNVGEMIAESPIANVSPKLAAGLGTAASTIGDIAAQGAILSPGDAQIALGAESAGIAGQIGAEALKPLAVGAARKALGFTKQHLHSTKSWSESLRKQAQMNKAAETMLNKGVISSTGNPEKMVEKALSILQDSGKSMDNVLTGLDDVGIRIDPKKLSEDLMDKLKPRFEDETKVVESIIKDLDKFPGGLKLTEAKTILKKRWGDLGYDKTFGTTATKMYRQASDVLEKSISGAVRESGGKELAESYMNASKTWGESANALKGLGNQMSMEMGNNLLDLPTQIIGAGQLAAGNPVGALSSMGILQTLRRRGMAPTALGINEITKGASPAFRSAGSSFLGGLFKKRKKESE